MSARPVHLRLFGTPRLTRNGQNLHTDRRKALALLVYLLLARREQPRDALAALLWPDQPADKAFAYLRRTLWELNQLLGEGWGRAERESVTAEPDYVTLDVAEFQRLTLDARTARDPRPLLIEATQLYEADFLTGFTLKDAPDFDEWRFFQAEGLRRDLAGALERLTQIDLDRSDFSSALPHAQRWVSLDPLHEPAHRQLMRAYAGAGQSAAAVHQYETCARLLRDELNTEPEAQTTALCDEIRRGSQPPPSPPAPSAPAAPRLPSQATPFIGRADLLAEIAARVRNPDCRCLTLHGPGGAGKTRLALQVAATLSADFAHGAFFAALAPVTEPALIVSAIADAVGFAFFSQTSANEPDQQKWQLLNFLGQKQLLLVLDNFEHLLAGVDLLPEILAAAPNVKLLVTSRERLNLQEEWVAPVAGMRAPDSEAAADWEATSAVRLFLHAAQRASADFSARPADRAAITRICQSVEGLPLALELAAAWVKTLSVQEIADEIARTLDFLVSPLRNTPERHQSLRAVFDYSWKLLTAPEQRAFQRLTVFQGGFTREAAQAVAGAPLPVLTALVDKALLHRVAPARYQLHEVLRQYAAEKLTPADEAATRTRHSAFYAGWMRAREAELWSHKQKQTLAEIATELDNQRAAWRWAVTQRDWETLNAILNGWCWFNDIRSRFQEAERVLGAALAELAALGGKGETEQIVIAKLRAWHGWFAHRLTHAPQTQEGLRLGLAELQRLGPRAHADVALVTYLAFYCDAITDVSQIKALARAAARYSREYQDHWGQAQILGFMALMEWGRGHLRKAIGRYQTALAIQRAMGDEVSAGRTLNWLGELHHRLGEYAEAHKCFQAAYETARGADDRWAMSLSLDYAGYVAQRMGDYPEARRLHEASLALSTDIGDQQGIAGSLDNLGIVALLQDQWAEARTLFERGYALRHASGSPIPIGISLGDLAMHALQTGDLALAEVRAREAQALVPGWAQLLADVLLAQGRLHEARETFQRAAAACLPVQDFPVALWCVERLGRYHAAVGETAQAIEHLTFVANHPATIYFIRERARQELEKLTAQADAEMVARAQARAASTTLETLLASLKQ